MINVRERILNYLNSLNSEVLNVRGIKGEENIKNYMKEFSDEKYLKYSTSIDRLMIKEYKDFSILTIIGDNTEIILVNKDKKSILKVISLMGVTSSKNPNLDNRIIIYTDVYLENENIITSQRTKDNKEKTKYEIYRCNDTNELLKDYFDNGYSLNVAYDENEKPINLFFQCGNKKERSKFDKKTTINLANFDITKILMTVNSKCFNVGVAKTKHH